MNRFNTPARKVLLIVGLAVVVWLGPRTFFFVINSAWSAGDGNGDLVGAMRNRWQREGGLPGFLHLTTDLDLAAKPEAIVSEAAAMRLLTQRQCDKEAGMIALLRSKPANTMVRVRLMEALAACGSKNIGPDIREALQEQSPMIVTAAAQSAGMLSVREAIPELEIVVGRCSAYCAGAAAAALSRMGERRIAYPWAVQVLSSERPARDPQSEDSFKRMFAGQVLQNIGTAKDIPLIEKNERSFGVNAEDYTKALLNRGEAH